MNTEKVAIGFLEESLAVTDLLDPFIKDGDKEPSWDGNIYIYSNKQKKKAGLKRIPVQVKGTEQNVHPSDRITFRMGIDDIDNYLRDGGVMLFVVYISKDCKRKTIYYDSLLPMKIRVLKERFAGKRRIPIECRPFPQGEEKMVSILLNFYSNMQKQRSFALSELKTIDELEKEGILEGLSFPLIAFGNQINDLKRVLFQDAPYLYAKIKGNAIPQPLQMIPIGIHLAETVNCDISVNGKSYYTSAQRIHSENSVDFCAGKSVRISTDGTKFTIKYTPASMLQDALIDTEFMLDVIDNNGFSINNTFLPLDESRTVSKDWRKGQKSRLEYCRTIHEVLNFLGLQDDVDISKSTDQDVLNTDRLYRGIVKREIVGGLKPELPPVATVDYYDKKLIVGFNEAGEPGKYHIYDFNSTPLIFTCSVDGAGENLQTSRYEILHPEDYLTISNVDLGKLVESYKELSDKDYIYERANLTALNLLTAYDQSGDTREDLLQCSHEIMIWLLEETPSEEALSSSIRKINLWQIRKRMGILSNEEKQEAFQLGEDTSQKEVFRVGAYLIADSMMAAESHFKKLSLEEKSIIEGFPISRYLR